MADAMEAEAPEADELAPDDEGEAAAAEDVDQHPHWGQPEGQIPKLFAMTLESIIRNLEYFQDQDDPFSVLPLSVFLMLRQLPPRLIRYPRYTHLFIRENLQKLELCCDDEGRGPDLEPLYWSKRHLQKLRELILAKCANTLESLELTVHSTLDCANRPQVTAEHLTELLSHLPRLKRLSVTDRTNSVLPVEGESQPVGLSVQGCAVLASTCPDLRSLMIIQNIPITSESFSLLCLGCKKLETLHIEPSLPESSLIMALSALPNLQDLNCKMFTPALLQHVKECDERTTPPRPELKYELEIIPEDAVDTQTLSRVARFFPGLDSLKLYKPAALTPYTMFRHIELLTISFKNGPVLEESLRDELEALFAHCTHLKELSLVFDPHNFMQLDLSVIGNYFPDLEALELETEYTTDSQYEMDSGHFAHLSDLTLRCTEDCDPKEVPDAVLSRLLSSPHLEHVCLRSIALPNRVMTPLIDKARRNRKVFSVLSEIDFTDTGVSTETVINLVSTAPNVEDVTLYDEDLDNNLRRQIVSSYLEQNMPHVRIHQ